MNLKSRQLDLQLTHTWTIARTQGMKQIGTVAVELTDSDGTTGLGEAAPVTRYNESVETVMNFLRRVDAAKLSFDDPAGSSKYLNSLSSTDSSAKCAVNIALHDGAARRSRKSIHEFLGLRFQEQRHITSFTIGIDTPDVIQQKVLAAKFFPVLKMKVGVAEDKANLAALRAIAPSKTIRVDANEGWPTKEHALKMIDWLAADHHVEFIEQPMPASTPESDWKWLKQRSPLPIFADESYHCSADVERAAACFHGVNVKLVKTGGITEAVNALRAARKLGLKTMLGCMIETSILISAAAQLAELADYFDLDGNLLITNDPYAGVTAKNGMLSFAGTVEKFGLQVSATQPSHDRHS